MGATCVIEPVATLAWRVYSDFLHMCLHVASGLPSLMSHGSSRLREQVLGSRKQESRPPGLGGGQHRPLHGSHCSQQPRLRRAQAQLLKRGEPRNSWPFKMPTALSPIICQLRTAEQGPPDVTSLHSQDFTAPSSPIKGFSLDCSQSIYTAKPAP